MVAAGVKRKHAETKVTSSSNSLPTLISTSSENGASSKTHEGRLRHAEVPKSGKEIKVAIDGLGSNAIAACNAALRVSFSQLPVPINHEKVVLAQQWLALDPKMEGLLKAWKAGTERNDKALVQASLHLLTSTLNLLQLIPYFQATLLNVVEVILSASEPYAAMLGRLVSSDSAEQAQLGFLLFSTLAHIESHSTIFASKGKASSKVVGRLTAKVWSTFVDEGGLRTLPKALKMRKKVTGAAAARMDPLDVPDIRILALRFLTAFLSYPSTLAAAESLTVPVFSGLKDDHPLTILRFLDALEAALVHSFSPSVNRKTALAWLNEHAISHAIKLFARDDADDEDDLIKSGKHSKTVAARAEEFLNNVCTIPGAGICFQDQGWYRRKGKEKEEEGSTDNPFGADAKGVHNRVLQRVVREIGGKVAENERVSAFVQNVLKACPELVAGYWPHSGISADPKLSSKWIASISFIGRIVSLPLPDASTFYVAGLPKPSPPPINAIVESIFPSPLLKAHLSKGLASSAHLVQHLTALVLVRCLRKLLAVQNLLQAIIRDAGEDEGMVDPWLSALRELEWEVRKRIPETTVILSFAQRSAAIANAIDEEDEQNSALVAKSSLLTEAALNLFRLSYEALPSLVSEVKFDVGRLLVTSSSAKAEARARKAAREEGSVVNDDDVGSVASIGTMGTAGLGGGFGAARTNVTDFSALSQIHVIELLKQAINWDWSQKAAGSAYTYFYHFLQLNLSTRWEITKNDTRDLIGRKVATTLLFQHDPSEIEVWLEALPLWIENIPAAGQAERLQLLDFLDDCLRRCLKTPHRYIEQMNEVFGSIPVAERPSPLLAACIEQLRAKIAGHHISTAAAVAALRCIRQVIFSLLYKLGVTGCEALSSYLEQQLNTATLNFSADRDQSRKELEHQAAILAEQLACLRGSPPKSTIVPATNDHIEGAAEVDIDRRRMIDASPGSWGSSVAAETERLSQVLQTLPIESRFIALPYISESATKVFMSNIRRQPTSLLQLRRLLSIIATFFKSHRDQPSRGDAAAKIHALLQVVLRKLQGVSQTARFALVAELKRVSPTMLFVWNWAELSPCTAGLLLQVVWEAGEDPVLRNVIFDGMSSRLAAIYSKSLDEEIATEAETVVAAWSPLLDASQASKLLLLIRGFAASYGDKPQDPSKPFEHNLHWRRQGIILLRCGVHVRTAIEALDFIRDCRLSEHAAPYGRNQNLRRSLNDSGTNQGEFDARFQNLKVSDSSLRTIETMISGQALDHCGEMHLLAHLVQQSLPFSKIVWHKVEHLKWRKGEDEAKLDLLRSFLDTGFDLSELLNKRLDIVDRIAESSDTAFAQELWPKLNGESRHRLLVRFTSVALENRRLQADAVVLLAQMLPDIGSDLRESTVNLVSGWFLDALQASGQSTEDAVFKATVTFMNGLTEDRVPSHQAATILTVICQDLIANEAAMALAATIVAHSDIRAADTRTLLQLLTSDRRLSRKANLVAFLKVLYTSNLYVSAQTSFLIPLLTIYRGLDCQIDWDIRDIFSAAERQMRCSTASLLLLWQPTGHLVSSPQRAFDVLAKLDSKQILSTASGQGQGDFDPLLILNLFHLALHQGGLSGLDWVELLRSHALCVVVSSLSSRKTHIRQSALVLLSKVTECLQGVAFQEKPALERIIRLLQHAHTNSRLPTLIGLFYAYCLRALADPSSFLYPIISAFLLRRPVMDHHDVPLLYDMLYASGSDGRRSRRWIVRLIRDGCRSSADWRLLRRRHTFALLASIYATSADTILKLNIIEAVRSMTSIPAAARTLVVKEGLLAWLGAVVESDSKLVHIRFLNLAMLEDILVAFSPTSSSPPVWTVEAELCLSLIAKQDLALEEVLKAGEIALRLNSLHALRSDTLLSLITLLIQNEEGLSIDEEARSQGAWAQTVEVLGRCVIDSAANASTAELASKQRSFAKLLRRAALLQTPFGMYLRSQFVSLAADAS